MRAQGRQAGLACLASLPWLLAAAFAEPPSLRPVFGGQDFRQFYAGAALLAQGDNPYDEAAVWRLQAGQDAYRNPHVTVSPPTTLLPYLPFAWLPYRAAMEAHAAFSVLLLLASAACWLRLAGAGWRQAALAALGASLWAPCGILVAMGQITALPLFAFTAWLMLMRAGRAGAAGAVLPLVLAKPHLGLALAVAGLAAMARQGRWRGLAAFGLVSGAGLVLPLLLRAEIYRDYLAFLTAAQPSKWITATAASFARELLGEQAWNAGFVVWGVALLVSAWAGARLEFRGSAAAYAWAAVAALALAGSIHAFDYDFVLLLPGFLLGLAAWLGDAPGRRLALLWLVLDAAIVCNRLPEDDGAWRLAPLPWLALALIWGQWRFSQAAPRPAAK